MRFTKTRYQLIQNGVIRVEDRDDGATAACYIMCLMDWKNHCQFRTVRISRLKFWR